MDLLTAAAASSKGGGSRPTDAQLRNWRGAFCIPNAIPNLSSHLPGFSQQTEDPNRIWTPAYGCYDDSGRATIRSEFRRRGYTHFVYNWLGLPYGSDYPNLAADPVRARRDLLELQGEGIIPVVCLLDERLGVDTSYAKPLADSCGDLIWIAMMMWECNEVLGVDSLDESNHWIGSVGTVASELKSLFPNTLLYAHFTPGHGAGGSPESDWWRDFTAGNNDRNIRPGILAGNLSQTDQFTDAVASGAGAESTAVRLSGICPPAPPDWGGINADTIAFEFQTTDLYHNGKSEEAGLAFSAIVLANAPHVKGVGDSLR